MKTVDNICNLPPLDAGTIQIWGANVREMLGQIGALRAILSAPEAAKADRYHRETDRQSSIIARGALRVLLSGFTGTPASEIEFGYCENGKPHVVDSEVEFNVSHSGEWVVLAFGRDRAIGVDIEQIKRTMDVKAISERYYSPRERDWVAASGDPCAVFFRLWARKEAYVKACGSTLFTELKRMSVPMEDGAERNGWFFHSIESGSKYAAAVVTNRPLAGMPCYDFGGLKWEN
ncbi:MAG TPA: 4'-phosphopantetheinyl transferase superfamily protein [Pontiella sp.]|nr:4'-phosphopantetheinyl transferase superfamily protein [Pontiella sp.]